jgi:hypothetical protein
MFFSAKHIRLHQSFISKHTVQICPPDFVNPTGKVGAKMLAFVPYS